MNKLILLTTIAFFSFGCSSLKKAVQPPKVELEDVRVVNLAALSADLEIVLSVNNPNDIDFNVDDLVYTLDVDSKKVTSGKLKEKVLVKAKDTTNVSLPLTLKYKDILGSVALFLKQEGMPYRVQGSAKIGPFTIPFDDSGNLKSSDL